MKKMVLLCVLFFLLSFLSLVFYSRNPPETFAQTKVEPIETVTYTPSSETHCLNNKCKLIMYSGTQFVPEDGVWKSIEDARSLMDKGFGIVYLEDDKINDIEVVDFNYTSITLKVFVKDDKSLGKDIPLKVDGNILKTVKLTAKNSKSSSQTIVVGNTETDNVFAHSYSFGEGSTTIIVNQTTSKVWDGYADQANPTTVNGAGTSLQIKSYSGSRNMRSFILWDLSSIPVGSIVSNATLRLFAGSSPTNTSRVTEVWNTTNNWNEGTLTWNNMPSASFSQSSIVEDGTGYKEWNVTKATISTVATGAINMSLMVRDQIEDGSTSNSFYLYSSEYTANPARSPQLTITYEAPPSWVYIYGVVNGTYPLSETIYCTGSSACSLTRNGTAMANNTAITLPAGGYSIVASITGNSTTSILSIAKGTNTPSLTGITNHTFGTTNTIICTGTVASTLWRNITNANNQNNSAITFPAGGYNWTCSPSDTQNYTGKSQVIQSISKGSLQGSVTGADVIYPTSVNICPAETNTGDSDVNYTFWRTETTLTEPHILVSSAIATNPNCDTTLLGADTYFWWLNSTGGGNWTLNTSIDIEIYTIWQGSQSISLTGVTNNTYPYSVTPVCTGNLTSNLYRNYSSASNNSAIQLGVAGYLWVCNTTTNSNYTFSSVSVTQSVSQNSTNPVNLYLNGTLNQNNSYTYPSAVNATGTVIYSSSGTVNLYRNSGSAIGNAKENILLGNGTYAYKVNITGNQNYTSNFTGITYYALVNKGTLSGTSSSPTVTYPTSLTATGTETNDGDTDVIYQEWCGSGTAYNIQMGVNVQDGNPSGSFQFGAGSYNCKLNTTGATFANWTASTSIGTSPATVNQGSRACTLATDKLWTRVYDGTASSTTCTVSAGSTDGSMTFTRNASGISTPDSQTNVADYAYACQWGAGVNYSACSQQTNTLSILKADYSTSLTGLGNRTFDGVTTDTPICTSNTTATFLRNGTASTWNNTATVFGVAGYNWTCFVNGDANHNPSSKTVIQSITKGTPTLDLYFNTTKNANANYAQGTGANFTGVLSSSGTVNLDSNYTGWVIKSGASPFTNTTTLSSIGNNWNMTAYYTATQNWTAISVTFYFNVTSAGGQTLTLDSITILPTGVIQPTEGGVTSVNVTVNITNTTTIDKCLIYVFNSTDTYPTTVSKSYTGTVQKSGSTIQCYQAWDMEYWRNADTWNVSARVNLTTAENNFTSKTFTYNGLTSLTINTSYITFSGVAGDSGLHSTDAYPMSLNNTGNKKFNITINGNALTLNGKNIGIGNVTYCDTEGGSYTGMTGSPVQITAMNNLNPQEKRYLYFRGSIPTGFSAGDYTGTISLTTVVT